MKNRILVLSAFFNLVLVLAACNSVKVPASSETATAKLHAFLGAVPGFHGLSGTKTTSFNFSLVPELHAQEQTTVSFSGSYSGFCAQVNPPSADISALALYGAGTLDTTCGDFYSDTAQDAAQNAAGMGGGALVIGDGTLGPLVAWANNSTATVSVFVSHNGAVTDTGIGVTLSGAGARSTSTATYPVSDGDRVFIISSGGPSTNLQAVLAKQ